MGARGCLAALLDEVGEGLIHERLQLTAFFFGKRAEGRQDLGIDLGWRTSRGSGS
jgi:hypothetical protein